MGLAMEIDVFRYGDESQVMCLAMEIDVFRYGDGMSHKLCV